MRGQMATKDDIADLRSEMHSLRADVASDLHSLDNKIDVTRKELSEQIVGLWSSIIPPSSATATSSPTSKQTFVGPRPLFGDPV